jgi:hypothetical protein
MRDAVLETSPTQPKSSMPSRARCRARAAPTLALGTVAGAPDRRRLVRTFLVAAALVGSLVVTDAAPAAPPVRDHFVVDVQFTLDGIFPECGFPVDIAIDGPFSVIEFQKAGVTTREIDTQPGAKLTYINGDRSISIPFAGVIHATYPEGGVLGAPARLVMTGSTGPFFDIIPMGTGRVVLDGDIVDVRGPFPIFEFTSLFSATGNFHTQMERVCSALAG